ncbi:MAG TPA: 50S ribosomal protein L4 [Synergistaceae bacterium]|jgi:large subunit ribosomal protein L4|nr:MAG: 50S ribosomal protein L4 [Synergistales bacterium 53_16]KUL00264.1 MAG: 50S ribosomal protein L4 [Synergistales bacterium 54_9]MDK2845628.1 large subunit ribosomal protein [Synergistales bacterium]HAA47367.1 50S ribosomal protein L4 [Synergistaceae bacterium]MDN5336378.1 large subunit ribosomal protein [Synergistales bacterium]
MPTVKVVNLKGEVVGEQELSDAVFAAPVHIPAMHQVVVAQQANRRQGTHSTKTRGEVRGGGRKPWRQKHTGRARHGSIRSPIWKGGGVTHGPKPRDYHLKVNRKVRRLALRSALSVKVREERLVVLDSFDLEKPKTRDLVNFFEAIQAGKKPLVVIGKSLPAAYKSVSNIPGAGVLHVDSINVYDLLYHDHLIVASDALEKIEEVLAK